MTDEEWRCEVSNLSKSEIVHVAAKWRSRTLQLLKRRLPLTSSVAEAFDGAVSTGAQKEVDAILLHLDSGYFGTCLEKIDDLQAMPSCDVGERSRGALRLLRIIIEHSIAERLGGSDLDIQNDD